MQVQSNLESELQWLKENLNAALSQEQPPNGGGSPGLEKKQGILSGFNYAPAEHRKLVQNRRPGEQRVYEFGGGLNRRGQNSTLSTVTEVGAMEVEMFRVEEVAPLTAAELAQQQAENRTRGVPLSPMNTLGSFPRHQEHVVPLPPPINSSGAGAGAGGSRPPLAPYNSNNMPNTSAYSSNSGYKNNINKGGDPRRQSEGADVDAMIMEMDDYDALFAAAENQLAAKATTSVDSGGGYSNNNNSSDSNNCNNSVLREAEQRLARLQRELADITSQLDQASDKETKKRLRHQKTAREDEVDDAEDAVVAAKSSGSGSGSGNGNGNGSGNMSMTIQQQQQQQQQQQHQHGHASSNNNSGGGGGGSSGFSGSFADWAQQQPGVATGAYQQPLQMVPQQQQQQQQGYVDNGSSSSKQTPIGQSFGKTAGLSVRDHRVEMKRIFGHSNFRQGQKECIEAALEGKDVFCLMPTGGGKSIVYQLPAVCCEGLSVVFSPLVSLIQDQVDSMNAVNIRAVYVLSLPPPLSLSHGG
jgi:hypothetical protein